MTDGTSKSAMEVRDHPVMIIDHDDGIFINKSAEGATSRGMVAKAGTLDSLNSSPHEICTERNQQYSNPSGEIYLNLW